MTVDTPLATQIPTKLAELFGGAITTQVPNSFVDASNFREVPDNQEVYVSMADDTDISLIVDILQRVDAADDEAALKVHFDDVISDRPGKVWEVQNVQLPNFPGFPAYTLVGTVSAHSRDMPTPPSAEPQPYTALLITVIRLAEKETDLVVTINVPFLKQEMVRAEGTIAAPGYTGAQEGERSGWLQAGLMVRDKALRALKIEDWGLFVDDA